MATLVESCSIDDGGYGVPGAESAMRYYLTCFEVWVRKNSNKGIQIKPDVENAKYCVYKTGVSANQACRHSDHEHASLFDTAGIVFGMIYITIRGSSVCLPHLSTTAAACGGGLLLWAQLAGDIDRLLHGRRSATTASSATLSADVGS